MDKRIRKVVIVGGGTAGWMTAATLGRFLKNEYCEVRVVESEEIGTVGVGESTIPQMRVFNRMLALDENEFVSRTQATFKLAIEFRDWKRIGESYLHPFGPYGLDMEGVSFHAYWLKLHAMGQAPPLIDYSIECSAARQSRFMRPIDKRNSPLSAIAYAFHFDAGLYARFLREFAEQRGVKRTEGRIVDVQLNGESGYIEAVKLADGQRVEGDLWIDCSGFRGLLIEQTLKTGFEDWSHWLINDRAWAVPCEKAGDRHPVTRAIARSAGWQWRIPLQHRIGNGYAFCSRFVSEDEAANTLLSHLEGKPLKDPMLIRFNTGKRLKSWNRNCVAIGLSAGFMEPLESQSIWLIQAAIARLLTVFPDRGFEAADMAHFNKLMDWEFDRIRDFLVLHFHATERSDTPYWDYCRNMKVPDYLSEKMALFQGRGRIFRDNNELFSDNSWFSVFLGQGIWPRSYDPLADVMPEAELRERMTNIHTVIQNCVAQIPDHWEFIGKNCAAKPM
ncbi:MAG TPA: tryptophan halogenase family protein [Steroidobacteraceae bacterium]|nr:tryptophan halogenase family protein [Steroidobacteraceae bacterium]